MDCMLQRGERDEQNKRQPRLLPARPTLIALAAAALLHPAASAQSVASLLDLSLEQLANIEVTTFSKRSQRLADVAGSVYVISSEDIRRSGAVSLPEVLRLAPNLQVARADANQYAITARGLNTVLANKMLVQIDGRTVYSPLFSGVFWEEHDLMLEDIDRIEVLSGSGGTLYGSNAVNGVINIISKPALDTQGGLISGTIGSNDRSLAARYGSRTDSGTAFRLYAKRTDRDATSRADGVSVRDAARHTRVGFRSDHDDGPRGLTFQGDAYEADVDQGLTTRRLQGMKLAGRWTQDLGDRGRTEVQAYFDRTERDQPGSIRDQIDTIDIDFQHASTPAPGHELVWGAGYRWQHDRAENIAPSLRFLPADKRLDLYNIFVQDEIALADTLKFTLGAKLEHNRYTGAEFLPNVRLAWNVTPNHLLWGAVSRTVRAPSRVDRDFFSPATPPFNIAGGPRFESEVVRVVEAGWRAQPTSTLSYSATVFHHDLDKLRSLDPGPGGATFNNNLEGRMYGLEAWATWRVTDSWKFNAGTVHLRERFAPRPGSTPINPLASVGNDPRSRWTLGTSYDFGGGHEIDVQARHIGRLPNPVVPSYTAVDLRWGWHVKPGVQLSLAVRNLGQARHVEWGPSVSRAEIERSVLLKATWRL
ncbi:MAG: TonB-dependent receptor [Pseudomonadota bacterium]